MHYKENKSAGKTKLSAVHGSYLAALGKKAFGDTGELGDCIASNGELHSNSFLKSPQASGQLNWLCCQVSRPCSMI